MTTGKKWLVGCGIGYTYFKEVESMLAKKYPVLKLGTLPIPKRKVLDFLKDNSSMQM